MYARVRICDRQKKKGRERERECVRAVERESERGREKARLLERGRAGHADSPYLRTCAAPPRVPLSSCLTQPDTQSDAYIEFKLRYAAFETVRFWSGPPPPKVLGFQIKKSKTDLQCRCCSQAILF